MQYWGKRDKLKEHAEKHTAEMDAKYEDEINECRFNTLLYKIPHMSTNIQVYSRVPTVRVINTAEEELPEKQENLLLVNTDSVSALFDHCQDSKNVTILNFADYKHAGGMFLKGSSAQEESLCHESFLYNILSRSQKYYEKNNQDLNRGMYHHKALLIPDVRFFHNGKEAIANVITCAAPNYSVALRYGNFTKEENDACMRERIDFIKWILADSECDTAILGAWGCGVFKQDPAEVARFWMDGGVPVRKVIHAIPDAPTYGAFQKVWEEFQ